MALHRFYKQATFYDNRCGEGDGGAVDNYGGDIRRDDFTRDMILPKNLRQTVSSMECRQPFAGFSYASPRWLSFRTLSPYTVVLKNSAFGGLEPDPGSGYTRPPTNDTTRERHDI